MKVLDFTLPKVNTSEVLRYMGVKNPTLEDKNSINSLIENLSLNITPKVVYEKFSVNINSDKIDLSFTTSNSTLIKKVLNCSSEVFLFTATIGLEIDRLINKYSLTSPSTALFYQALGTERVETLCDEFCAYLSKEISPLALTKRISPGYGDIPLSMQKDIFSALNPTKYVGVSLLDSMLMSPTKSVTAIVGLSNCTQKESNLKCDNCNKTDCDFKK